MTDDPTPFVEPTEIGPYKLLDLLGEGGMGMVYLAEQMVPVRRRVALKVLKPGMDTKQVLARFESERQALAVMDHPNIAKVLDSGVTAAARPFFVMELVHGTPITHYADTHRLTVTERLRLFLDVCAAVQHAHHKGVIHRDLKPSNVLVAVQESGPAVKVIDFGIAKAVGLGLTERTLVTRAGQILGTPEYMSPEQAEMSGLDVDTRTDVYSLGVMLYELLVGVLPFDLAAKPDYVITNALRERDVPRPSTRLTGQTGTLPTVARHRRTSPEALRREVKGDLDWIILKAMEKDRTHRYDTPRGLANDIRRHLSDEPVEARPPSATYLMGKFVRRNRRAVLAASVAAAAVLIGAAAATVGFVHAREEQRKAQQAAAIAEEITDFLVGLFQVSDPGEARGDEILAREVLDRGAAQIGPRLAAQPAIQAPLMRIMGTVYHNLGLYDPAVRLFEDAIAIGDAGTSRNDVELVRALRGLATAYRQQGRLTEAQAAAARAVDVSRAAGLAGTADGAAAADVLARVYSVMGRYAEAETLLREAIAVQERVLGPDHPDLARSLGNLAGAYLRQRMPDEAEPLLRRAIAIYERAYGPDHMTVGMGLVNLGAFYYVQGRHDESELAYQRGLQILQPILRPQHPNIATALANLGEIYWTRGEFGLAESHARRALEIQEGTMGPDHPSLAVAVKVLANSARDQGRYQEAGPLYDRVMSLQRRLDAQDPAVLETMEAYARFLRMTGQDARADSVAREAAGVRVHPAASRGDP